jgi:plasmid maintenance system antidote protein VapI
MWLIKLKYWAKKLAILGKNYWWVFPLVVLAFFLSKYKPYSLAGLYTKKKDIAKKELEELESIHAEEVKEILEVEKHTSEQISLVEKKLVEKKETLKREHKKRIKEIVKESKDEPDEMAKKIADEFGFTVTEIE